MYINAYSTSSAVDRLYQVNAGLTSLLRTLTNAPTNNSFQTSRPATLTTALSGQDTLSVTGAGSFASSLGGLLSSVGTAADSVSKSRLTLGTIRAQLKTILSVATEARDDRGRAGNQANGQLIIDRAVAEINRLTGAGKNATSEASAARRAELILPGAAGGIVEDNVTFRVSGALGEAVVSVSTGDSLADVALGINELTLQTGVSAAIDGDNLIFQSVGVGSDAAVSVLPVPDGTTVSGVNSGQLVDVVLNSVQPNSRETITGTVSSAEVAELSYDGNVASLIFDTGTFSFSGNLGSGSFTFNAAESLAGLASLVNQQTESTGISAAVSGSQLVFHSVETGTIAQISIGLDYNELSVSGENPSQVAGFEVLSLLPGSNNTIAGDITTSAEQAEQTYTGQDGRVTNSATIELMGNLDSETLSIQRGELLTDVADRVNQLTATTGVTASVDGDDLVFTSVNYGSGTGFSVEVTSLVDVADVNNNQIIDFQVDSIAPNSNQTISGSVVDAAEQAQLKYLGGAGSVVKDDATFDVAGNLGSASFTVTEDESLADVADRINQQSAATGVTATVVNNDLFLNSVDYGTSAQAFVEVTSGKFGVSGGTTSGNGKIDYGTDVKAKINGVDHFGDGNRLTVSDGFGAYTLEFAGGFDGDFNLITVVSASTEDVINVSDVNSSQFEKFQVNSIDAGDYQTISGSVVDAAEQAQLKYSGGAGSVVKDDATFDVAGNLGSASFTVTEDESLADVADRINQQSAATGVTATVVNNDLFLNSVDYGTSAQAFVEVTSGKFGVSGGTTSGNGKIDYGTDVKAKINGVDHFGDGNQLLYSQGSGSFTLDFAAGFDGSFDTIDVASTLGADNLTDGEHANATGVNNDQFVSFQVDVAVPDSVQVVSGKVVDAAEQAELKYSGGGDSVVKDDATFDVAGNLGSDSFTVTKDESLADVADRINQQTAATGVTATVVDDDLFLNSVGYGTSAQAFVEVTSGKFDVSGGDTQNGGEIDYGADVKAKINGVDYFGDGNELSFSDAAGSFSVEFVAGFDGDFDTVAVGSINNAFNLSGGNGNGTANGVDAQAVINGQSLTASGNRLSFSDSLGSYTLDLATGFVGTLDPISVASTVTAYSIDGGNGDGTAQGQDAEAVINGQTLSGNENQFAYDSETGSYVLEFVDGFTGAFDEIEVLSIQSGQFDILGGNGDGTAYGTDAESTLPQGDTEPAAAVSFSVVNQLRHLGTFSLELDAASLGGPRGNLLQLATGGSKSDLNAHAVDAVQVAEHALTHISNIESLLDSATARGATSFSQLVIFRSGRDARAAALANRSLFSNSDIGRFGQSILDPRLVLDLLQTTTS